MAQEILQALSASVERGDRAETAALTQRALDEGVAATTVLDQGLLPGIRRVGDLFATGEYFLPDMLVAAAAMKSAMAVLDPVLKSGNEPMARKSRVLIGTVRGDIHEIGKSLVSTLLGANGFEVIDLGVDVPAEKFVEAVRDQAPDVLGLSALLTTTMGAQRTVVEALKTAGVREQVKVMVGGAPVTQRWADEIGADGYAPDAVTAVALARTLSPASA
jgi:corrinoid protein of di/trimethylamine methyltransferase